MRKACPNGARGLIETRPSENTSVPPFQTAYTCPGIRPFPPSQE
ncbi:hypothetical protein ACLD9W_08445 [Neisseria sp. WLZKY-1]